VPILTSSIYIHKSIFPHPFNVLKGEPNSRRLAWPLNS
jgi:hypothetical protein